MFIHYRVTGMQNLSAFGPGQLKFENTKHDVLDNKLVTGMQNLSAFVPGLYKLAFTKHTVPTTS